METQVEIRNVENGSLSYRVNFSKLTTKLLTVDEYDRINNLIENELEKIIK